jgi:hypothetical protein
MNTKSRQNEKVEELNKVITPDVCEDANVEMFNFYNKDIGDYIHPKHDLLLDCKNSSAISIIIKHLKVIPNFAMKSNNTEILRACNLIENLGIQKKGDVTKKDVFINVYKQLFSDITDESLSEALHIIDFLLAHKLIRKIKIYKRVVRFVKLNLLPTFLY